MYQTLPSRHPYPPAFQLVDLPTNMGTSILNTSRNLLNHVQKGNREQPLPRNELYERLKGQFGSRTVYGNVLVIKTDTLGLVCDVLDRELFFVERLVYRSVCEIDLHRLSTDIGLVTWRIIVDTRNSPG